MVAKKKSERSAQKPTKSHLNYIHSPISVQKKKTNLKLFFQVICPKYATVWKTQFYTNKTKTMEKPVFVHVSLANLGQRKPHVSFDLIIFG